MRAGDVAGADRSRKANGGIIGDFSASLRPQRRHRSERANTSLEMRMSDFTSANTVGSTK